MDYIGNVQPKRLGLLSTDAAVNLFRALLWLEADRAGIGPASVSVPSAITVPDGGVDAEVTDVPHENAGGLLHPGITRYQIKTGAFSANTESELRALFLKEKSDEFKPRVRSCFEKNGTFVVVLFGSDTPERSDDETAHLCQQFIGKIEPAFQDRSVRILRQNKIAGFVNRYPALAYEAQSRSFPNLRSHEQWGQGFESQIRLQIGPAQQVILNQIRDELRQTVVRHICVWGEPGVGKTRLVYEATVPEDLSYSVAYFNSAKALRESGVVDELVNHESKHAIVVVDDCESRDGGSIWRELKGLGRRVRLITIQHDPCGSSGTTVGLQIPELAREQIIEIIKQHGIPTDAAGRFAELCGGSPRVADVVGSNLENNPEDLTRALDLVDFWERFIEGLDSPSSDAVARRRTVLRYLSLFKKFGYGEPYQGEAKAIASCIERDDPTITWNKFQETVRLLRQRRILQGETTLYITPKLLHIRLWSDWWIVYGENFDVEQFLSTIPDTLHEWFFDMFAYAHRSRTVSKAVRAILNPHAEFFKQDRIKTEVGANFFLSLTEADTEAALDFLEATLGTETREQLTALKAGRQRIVWALQKIAVERNLFHRAARILLRLAETENEPSGWNIATRAFAGLFSLGPGKTAPTQALPSERLSILREALANREPITRSVGLLACDQALGNSFSRAYGAERRGLNDLELWSPKTYAEWFDAYREVWQLLSSNLNELKNGDRFKAGSILLSHAFDLVQIDPLAELVTQTVRGLVDIPGIPRKKILETALDVLERSESLPDSVKRKWEEIQSLAAGANGFRSRLRSQLTLPPWRMTSGAAQSTKPWSLLAEEAAAKPDEFLAELEWLTSSEAESAGPFGYELGKLDRELEFQQPIIEAVKRADSPPNSTLLGGYERAIHETQPDKWILAMRDLGKTPEPGRFFPSVLMQSGLTDESAEILTDLIRRGRVPAYSLQGFIFGGEIGNLAPSAFTQWLLLLLEEDEQRATLAALQLLHHYARHTALNQLPSDPIDRVLLHKSLFEKELIESRGSHRDFDWSEVAQQYLLEHPERKVPFAKALIDSMGEDNVLLPSFGHSYVRKSLSKIATEMPSEIWSIVTPLIGPPIGKRARSITDWLQGGMFSSASGDDEDAILNKVPRAEVFAWVEKDVDRRAWYLASFVPKLTSQLKLPIVSRELLIRYGDRDDVQRSLIVNYNSEGWVGPESEHYQGKKDALERMLEAESEPRVREWLNRYIGELRRSISRADAEEERRDF